MTHMLKPWKIKALIGVVLFVMIYPCPPSTLKCNIWEGTLVSILTSMAHCGSSVTNVTHPSTSNVPLRNQKIVSGLNVLFVHFFVADNSKFELLGFISPPVHCLLIFHYVLCSFSLKKMGRNKICPDSDSKESSTGGSAHKNKQSKPVAGRYPVSSDSNLNTVEIVTKHVNNLCILVIICNWLIFSHWQPELGPCRTSTSLQIGSCSNQLYNRSYCSDLFNHTQVYIIAENMEKALNIWRNIQSRINSGDSAKMLPTRAEVAALYKINYKTFCHRVNGRTAAKGHASGGARRGRIFTVGKYIILI